MNVHNVEPIGHGLFPHPVADIPECFTSMVRELAPPRMKVGLKVFRLVDEYGSKALMLTSPACSGSGSDPSTLNDYRPSLPQVVFDDRVQRLAYCFGALNVTFTPVFRLMLLPLRVRRVEVMQFGI